jgi:hypothetical protein
MSDPVICAKSTSPATKVSIAARVYINSALNPFLFKSPPTSATHKTPWVGATAENATLTLTAPALGMCNTITSRALLARTSKLLMQHSDRWQDIMAPVSFLSPS